jgi:hypothetical protein
MSRTDLGDDPRARLVQLEDIGVEAADDGQAVVEAAERLKRKAQAAEDRGTRRPRQRPAPDISRTRSEDPAPVPASALDGVAAGKPPLLSLWGWCALVLAVGFLVGTVVAVVQAPQPTRPMRYTVKWLPGPQVPDAQVFAWMARFPEREKLVTAPNEWVLDRLVAYLKATPGVAEVARVSLVHEPVTPGSPTLIRSVRLELGLHEPFLPGVLLNGQRVWIDRAGRVLPGYLPAPEVRRPMLRQIEAAKAEGILEAVRAWTAVEAGLKAVQVTDIAAADRLDETSSRGVVLVTSQGARLIWGRPGEERYGVDAERKAANLLHALRCQGDLARVDTINVRFTEPFYTLRDNARQIPVPVPAQVPR